MTRTRIVLTLILVATFAMLVGLAASVLLARRSTPRNESRPEATEPHRPQMPSHAIANA